MSRPTPEQTAEARAWFTENQLAALRLDGFENTAKMVAILLAATKPPTDMEIGDFVRARSYPSRIVERWAYIIATDVVRHFLGKPGGQ